MRHGYLLLQQHKPWGMLSDYVPGYNLVGDSEHKGRASCTDRCGRRCAGGIMSDVIVMTRSGCKRCRMLGKAQSTWGIMQCMMDRMSAVPHGISGFDVEHISASFMDSGMHTGGTSCDLLLWCFRHNRSTCSTSVTCNKRLVHHSLHGMITTTCSLKQCWWRWCSTNSRGLHTVCEQKQW